MVNQFNILDYTDGPLLKTGQTTDYTPAVRTTKDDGGFQRGIAGSKEDRQYIVLTDGQYSGTTAITVNLIVDNHSNECVFDKVTGIMWLRFDTPPIYGTGNQDLLWDDTAGNNEDIFEYCDQANLSNLSGFSDWRIPNSDESLSIATSDLSIISPRINKAAFPSLSIFLHTSTTRVTDVTAAWGINYSDGRLTPNIKTTGRRPTALIRLGI